MHLNLMVQTLNIYFGKEKAIMTDCKVKYG